MPQNSQFVKDPPATSLRDSNDALSPVYWGGKSFMPSFLFLWLPVIFVLECMIHVLHFPWHSVREREYVVDKLPDNGQQLSWISLVS